MQTVEGITTFYCSVVKNIEVPSSVLEQINKDDFMVVGKNCVYIDAADVGEEFIGHIAGQLCSSNKPNPLNIVIVQRLTQSVPIHIDVEVPNQQMYIVGVVLQGSCKIIVHAQKEITLYLKQGDIYVHPVHLKHEALIDGDKPCDLACGFTSRVSPNKYSHINQSALDVDFTLRSIEK